MDDTRLVQLHPDYPSAEDVDQWCRTRLDEATQVTLSATPTDDPVYSFQLGVRHSQGNRYVAFRRDDGETFWGYWQPTTSGGPAPLLVHVPGYGAEMSAHPELVAEGFNVLHVNPLGYAAPSGPDEAKRPNKSWPVLPDTVATGGNGGYVHWLRDALSATLWGLAQPCVQTERLAFFGTSQGGGTALLLASIMRDRGVKAAAADVPFLTSFPKALNLAMPGAYGMVRLALKKIEAETPDRLPSGWRALGFIDTCSHAHRLTMPTLLTSGADDPTCPPATIESLFEQLPGTRSYTEIAGQGHAYTPAFIQLAKAWFRLYV